jgi:glycosyltransferase involved in cell wall biosynthesis
MGAGLNARGFPPLAGGIGRGDAVKILFIHQNFPGQFVHLAAALARNPANQVLALAIHKQEAPKGVHVRHYTLLRTSVPQTHPLLQDQEAKVLRAEACAAAAMQLKHEGFVPDVIYAHPGWGEALLIKEVFPQARLVVYCEYYYALEGQDVGFDPEIEPLTFQQRCQLRLRNTTNLLSLDMADVAISPTQWQKSTYPKAWHDKIHVIHDGIDMAPLKPNPNATLRLAANAHHAELVLRPGMEVVSYVARNLEAVRGFHQFMRVLPQVLDARPGAHAVIVGGDGLSYGGPAPDGRSWKDYMMREVGGQLDMRRVHFVGKIPYGAYLNLLNVSKVHTYWTTPFVLSWSLLEAALHGVLVVASDTPPVREFSDRLGIQMADFFDQTGFADYLSATLHGVDCPRKNKLVFDEIELPNCIGMQTELLSLL